MTSLEFKKILFQAAFSIMACDGEIHDTELSEIKDIAENSIFFDGLNHEEELQMQVSIFKAKGGLAIQDFFKLIQATNLSAIQEEHLIEVLIRIINADHKVDENEVHFLSEVRRTLKIDDTKLVVKFPKHINLLLNLSQYDSKNIAASFDNLNFDNVSGFLKLND
ncbi:MAG: TerB family tellurite resistance protein [Bacteroidota bacterium]